MEIPFKGGSLDLGIFIAKREVNAPLFYDKNLGQVLKIISHFTLRTRT